MPTQTLDDMPPELAVMCRPQLEQLGIKPRRHGAGWVGVARGAEARGGIWVCALGRNCLVIRHEVTPLRDLEFREESSCDYACACVGDAATRAQTRAIRRGLAPAAESRQVMSFLQPAGSVTSTMRAGMTYRSSCVCLTPGYFRELERTWPGEFEGLFESFSHTWDDETSGAVVSTLRALGPSDRPGAALAQRACVERMVATLACAQAEDRHAQLGCGSHESSALVSETQAYVDAHVADDLRVERIARALYAGRTRLCTTFRAETGVGLAEYVRTVRMRIARDLLATTDLAVSGVARQVGYPHASAFSSAFARETGMTPSAWRGLHG